MTTEELKDRFHQNHRELIDFIGALEAERFLYAPEGKWSAGQQLAHVYLCLMPLSKALASKSFIREKFGTMDRPGLTYEQVIENYKKGLQSGGKAPSQFLPEQVTLAEKDELTEKLSDILHTIRQQLDAYRDEELDTLVLPHPFLGKLSVTEMFYLMSYHATHHLEQAEQNLIKLQ